jgi:hypothetical protein
MRKITCIAIVSAAVLAGCANPIRVIDAPGYSLTLSEAPRHEPRSMREAVQKLNHVRATYYEAVREQASRSQATTSGLVWLGSAIVGLAAGGAHRDAILYPALVGGTAYGLSQTEFDGRRVQIWNEGIKALDCAKEASIPLDLPLERMAQIEKGARALIRQRAATQIARDAADRELAANRLAPDDAAPIQTLISRTDTALAAADQTTASALELLKSAQGRELSAAVDRISAKVNETMSTLTLNPAAVRQMIAGIGGFASVFAPGAGLEPFVQTALASYDTQKKTAGAQGAIPPSVVQAAETLKRDLQKLGNAQSRLASLLGGVSVAGVSSALKKCDVAGVVTALTFDPPVLTLSANKAQTEEVEIKGGLRPYEIRVLGEVPAGMAITSTPDTVLVKVNDQATAGEYRIRVRDSSSPAHSSQLLVKVGQVPASNGAATGGTTGSAGAGGAGAAADVSDVAGAWSAFIGALTDSSFRPVLSGTELQVKSATLKDSRLLVTLACNPTGAGLPSQDVRDELADADPGSVLILRDAHALDSDLSQIDLTASGTCVKP